MGYRLSELSERIGAELRGEDLEVEGVSALELARERELSFVESRAWLSTARKTRAAALLVPPELAGEFPERSLLVCPNVRVALARVAQLFWKPSHPAPGISPLAVIEEGAELGEGVSVGPWVYVGAGARIGEGSMLYPGVFVGAGAEVGRRCVLYPYVVLYPGVRLGDEVVLHAGTVIGADGFGYAQEWTREGLKHLKIPHFGTVEIGEEVEIGANACVDRATFGVTRIGAGTKIDNLTQIGHNVEIGEGAIIVAQCGVSGHARVGRFVMMGGQVGLAPGAQIGEGAKIAAKSGVSGKIAPGEEVAGIPAIPVRVWRKAVVAFAKLPDMVKELRKLKALLGGKK
ncbi:UDP-3-O-(3-hydroxymyristoyl)glucosamine N-acyltransferase [Thermosulfurimonas dismutans]|uniref:UDP-3-O-acylglucosamine N-acyltransferase n=1 Tax=Thermosulfurimonas dismutans TaxID=999894 RepID=A0A179D2E8_9BACT|nr:UDP-3-O-(3-hydroxymyristoyl)glucosamine N-acyltransferase [Thermosulfurimonas dismutans]OAQ20237.1 UDP-3-O-[3-hydroxymyristoyl] glucosamine N-acyltransferase [Thermosulfurimonas dismutans]